MSVKTLLTDKFNVFVANTYDVAEFYYKSENVHLALLDIKLDGSNKNGIDFLKFIRKENPSIPVIMLSAIDDIATVFETGRIGAVDFIPKPFDKAALKTKIDSLISNEITNRTYQRAHDNKINDSILISSNPRMMEIKRQIEDAGDARILIYGETGVGKTPVAWYSHNYLFKEFGKARPFEYINCSLFSEDKLQDMMFGHKKGSFTSAISDTKGLVEEADGGDFFLDEVGDLKYECQTMLLLFLDNGEFRKVGETKRRKVEVRIIAATNRDLKKMVAEGTFRKDLYSRLKQLEITVPPLRERKEDVKPLLEYFICKKLGYSKHYDPVILNTFMNYDYEEGNVRELKDAVELMCTFSRHSDTIQVIHLPAAYRQDNIPDLNTFDELQKVYDVGLESYVDAFEKNILKKIKYGSQKKLLTLSKELKIPRTSLRRKMLKYNIPTD